MPTTSNFGWTTPADTDLVKDGAAAIRTLGNGIDTSLVDLKGGTTGQVLSKNSNTDLDFTWIAQDDSNAIQNALLTTTGDTIYASGASTPARLGIGSAGQVLTVSGGVPTWATPSSGGMTLISTTTFNGTPTTVLSSIPSTYLNLRVVIRSAQPASDGSSVRLRINNDSTASRHRSVYYLDTENNTSNITFNNDAVDISRNNDNASTNSLIIMDFPDYTNTATWKMVQFISVANDATTTTNMGIRNGVGYYNQTSAISSLGFLFGTGNATSGTILLYGVR